MDDAQRARVRELLELVSRTVEANPGANAPTIRTRARVKRKAGDMALDLLLRGGFIEHRQQAFRLGRRHDRLGLGPDRRTGRIQAIAPLGVRYSTMLR